jgi:hypothetical protein
MADVFKDARKKEYLNREGADKPLKSPIPLDTLKRARAYRKRRMIDQLARHDCAAILLYDPVNIRYALDVSNMQLWMTHNASHYAMVCADGHAIDFEYGGAEHLARNIETVDEVRRATAWYYFAAGTACLNAWRPGPTKLPRSCGSAAAETCGWRSTGWSRPASTPCAGAASPSSRARSSPKPPAPSRASRSSS